MLRRSFPLTVFLLSLLVQMMVIVGLAISWKPDFYRRTLLVSHDQQRLHGEAVNALLEQFLQNALTCAGPFEVTLTDEQINGWLAVELPCQQPAILPPTLKDPRVAIESDCLRVACRYHDYGTRATLQMALSVIPTDESNQVQLQVLEATIGSVPGLEHEAVRPLSYAAWRCGTVLRWKSTEHRPEAVASLRPRWLHHDRQLFVDDIRLQPGQLTIAGRVVEVAAAARASEPRR